jgi:hypothetical protein
LKPFGFRFRVHTETEKHRMPACRGGAGAGGGGRGARGPDPRSPIADRVASGQWRVAPCGVWLVLVAAGVWGVLGSLLVATRAAMASPSTAMRGKFGACMALVVFLWHKCR